MNIKELSLFGILPFLLSFLSQILLIRLARKSSFCIDKIEDNKPQRFHYVPTPRSGGLGIFVASIIALCMLGTEGIYIIISALPVFAAGFYEDMRSNFSPKWRLLFIGAGAVLAIILLNTVIFDIGIARLPLWIAVPFTILAVTGIPNAVNIIDGFNGLAAGVSIIAFTSYAALAALYSDPLLLSVCVILIAAIAGFLCWNFPGGRVFLGDGGAYFIGFILAVTAILVTKRHPEISPWFPVVVFAYPIFEVLFSIYRRKLKRGLSPFEADRSHLHTLIYKRKTRNNPKTSVYLWAGISVFNMAAFFLRENTPALILVFLMFSVSYVVIYKRLVRFGR